MRQSFYDSCTYKNIKTFNSEHILLNTIILEEKSHLRLCVGGFLVNLKRNLMVRRGINVINLLIYMRVHTNKSLFNF